MTKEELSKKYGNEEVFVVHKEDFNFIEDGLTKKGMNELINRFKGEGFFVLRKDAEYNPDYLQLIPYVLIQNKESFFTTKCLGGDERIIGKISLGMGGHINPVDIDQGIDAIFMENIKREISKEELNIEWDKTVSCNLEGFIRYTDKNDIISQDHLALFYTLETNDSHVSIKEEDKLEGRFMSKEEILQYESTSESWSKIIINQYIQE